MGTAVGPGTGAGTGVVASGTEGVEAEPASGAGPGGSYSLRMVARFAPPTAFVPSRAMTYDQSLVPAGAGIDVEQRTDKEGTVVILRASGLVAGHKYGVHVHTGVCGSDPAAAGGHYQHVADPVQPSVSAAYANADNEIWLDFTADAHGAGRATARHDWHLRSKQANSVVIHSAPGGSGDRVACFTVPFRGW
ncbi:hypothetical protein B1H18_20425 [Streptomyces tsukubensis]|uniref:Uncharacterized protein n=3 Tax=Streptomyces tsukubensis TaxID=83656 RepID=A0A1V4A6Q6_9ACTN|nr:hypothetical protein B1H18_20425 [Streptomyces tsukubensis]